jgi:leader peptidase (prepilin peptidase)/N-methyltransferase
MLAVAATDLRSYLIPDRVTLAGLVWGVSLATLSGDLQIEHVWCDWNQEVPQIAGAYIPAWIASHPHVHGFVWSAAGAAFGAAAVWVVRAISSAVLGKETMGLGDVTLMAMIGSFLGWQPVALVLLAAPLCALGWHASAGLFRLAGGRQRETSPGGGIESRESAATTSPRSYVPYGPYLCLATGVILATWRWIWMFELRLGQSSSGANRINTFAVRRLFGDWQLLAALGAAMLAALVLLLVLRRAYLAIPVTRGRTAGAKTTHGAHPCDDDAETPTTG